VFDFSGRRFRPTFLNITVKAAIATAALSVFAVHWITSAGEDRTKLSQLAAQASRLKEPAVTGSLRELRLDPCGETRPR
jgi:hypothetical protein